jgi:hypothetical protein
MTIFCVLHRCGSFDCSLSSTRKIPLSQSLHMMYDMSVFQSRVSVFVFNAEFNFTVSFFDLYCYINVYHWNNNLWQVVMLCSVLKLTVWCFLFFPHQRLAFVNGNLSVWAFEGGQTSVSPTLQCGSEALDHPQECLYQGLLLQILLMFCWLGSSIQVEQRDLRHMVLGRACVNRNGPLLEGLGYFSD